MSSAHRFLAAAFVLCAGLNAAAQAAGQAPDQATLLKETLAKLKASSARFTSAEAHVSKDAYVALVKDHTIQAGDLYVIREKDGKTQMGLRTTGQGARVVSYKDGTLKDFNPGLHCFNAISRPGIDTYLTLGFGADPDDLQKAWQITDLGPDTFAGTRVEKLDLIPKDLHVRENVTKVSLWVDLDRDVALKQVFYSPSNDTNTAIYNDIRINKHVNTGPFAISGGPCK